MLIKVSDNLTKQYIVIYYRHYPGKYIEVVQKLS